MSDALRTSVAVCERLGCTYRQLYSWVSRGFISERLTRQGSGARLVWTPEEIDRAREIKAACDAVNEASAHYFAVTGQRPGPSMRSHGLVHENKVHQ